MTQSFDDVQTFAEAVPMTGVVAGLDLGTKTIGLAVSDLRQNVATPRQILKRKKFGIDAQSLSEWLTEVEAVGIVLGLPRNMDGSEGPRAQSTRAFARNFLQAHAAPPILFWDERLSTQAAHSAMLDADLSRKRRAELIDSVAAGLILQNALDRLGYLRDARGDHER